LPSPATKRARALTAAARHRSSKFIFGLELNGQSPIDTARYIRDGSNDPAAIISKYLAPSELSAIGPTEDDVALLWLANSANTSAAVNLLETTSPASPPASNIAGIGRDFLFAIMERLGIIEAIAFDEDFRSYGRFVIL
jgi:hypothetical protein